jgi:hypothetical protein
MDQTILQGTGLLPGRRRDAYRDFVTDIRYSRSTNAVQITCILSRRTRLSRISPYPKFAISL